MLDWQPHCGQVGGETPAVAAKSFRSRPRAQRNRLGVVTLGVVSLWA